MIYTRRNRVEFNHCDPAGIVFYPRYFEMVNSVVENFFRDAVGVPFEAMFAEGVAVPTARIETEFRAPSRLGDELDWSLVAKRLGQRSVEFAIDCHCAGQLRLTTRVVLVHTGADLSSRAWPAGIREVLAQYMETS